MRHLFERCVRIVLIYVMRTIRIKANCFLTHTFFTTKNTLYFCNLNKKINNKQKTNYYNYANVSNYNEEPQIKQRYSY